MTYKVYDKVWIMINNMPTEMLVYAIVEEMGFTKRDTDLTYRLVSSTCGATFEKSISASTVHSTKRALIESLLEI